MSVPRNGGDDVDDVGDDGDGEGRPDTRVEEEGRAVVCEGFGRGASGNFVTVGRGLRKACPTYRR